MKIHQDRKSGDLDTHLPGCLGVMAYLFDVSTGLARNKLLTDRPHHEGSPVARSLSDVAISMDPLSKDQVKDIKTTLDLQPSSYRKSKITPIKMLIAQEMSRELDFEQSSPNLVAKLMGLDTIPIQLPKSITQKGLSRSYLQQSRSLSHSGRQTEYSHHGRSLSDSFPGYQEINNYREIYDIWQKSQKCSSKKDKFLAKGRGPDIGDEKKMAFVREKFMEAKRLARDEKLRQSKEFQDAVEVLSSNRDLFLQILQEPISLFPKPSRECHSIPSPAPTKRITILRPSKMVDRKKFSARGKKIEYMDRKSSYDSPETGWDQNISVYSSHFACQEVDDYPMQPTRIVLLKPDHGSGHHIRCEVPPPSSSCINHHDDDFFEEDQDNEVEKTGEAEKKITCQLPETFEDHKRDETLVSSVFSNGYIGDDSSINRSENECLEGNFSDSEVVSPTSRHSWDFINRNGSPNSTSSSSHASYSLESSVCKEAKKRLFERWTLMAASQNSLEQRHAQKSSSTLGEMLTLSDSRKTDNTLEERRGACELQELAGPSSPLTYSADKETHLGSLKNVYRSKSVPASSTGYDNQLNVHVSEPKNIRSMESLKKATEKSSFKLSLSTLFFSMSRKSSKDKTGHCNGNPLPTIAGTASSSGYPHEKAGSSILAGTLKENKEQPSPISPLDRSFEEDQNGISEVSGNQVSDQILKSNLIDKSPPIGSLVRTLSWDNSYTQKTSAHSLKTQTARLCREEEEENELEWLLFIRTLLSLVTLDGECPSDPTNQNLYLPESLLDDECPLPEAKRRQKRSIRKLVLDYTSALIVEMKDRGDHEGPISEEWVWAQMKEWFMKEVTEEGSGGLDSMVVRNEVVETWRAENLRLEVDRLEMEIEWDMLQELVDEAVNDMPDTAIV
ncbi:hypothetical protein SAY86_001960 [Trapa natans]|uniref:DUF4378 domain-containing protein n=1 Tax=Trapa natans TaxID=22666 RepID=A0AAN7LR69_TRANT|nr:hypothetical protein SAY86_001960 [Trapa natans]